MGMPKHNAFRCKSAPISKHTEPRANEKMGGSALTMDRAASSHTPQQFTRDGANSPGGQTTAFQALFRAPASLVLGDDAKPRGGKTASGNCA